MMQSKRKTCVAALLFPILGFPIPGIRAQSGLKAAPDDLAAARRLMSDGAFAAARQLLEPLANGGNAAAQTELGLLLYFGRGVTSDEARAHALFKAAAGREEAAAMFWLGHMALLGDGPEGRSGEADRAAARWFFEAARRGHADAQYHLGLLLLAGTGVYADRVEAMKWINRAAAAGHPAAQRFAPGADSANPPAR